MSARHARDSKRIKRIGFFVGRLPPRCQWWKDQRQAYRSWVEHPRYPKTRGKRGWR